MARYQNKGPVYSPNKNYTNNPYKNLRATQNWATGEKKALPYTVPTGGPDAGQRVPQSFEEAYAEKEDFIPKAGPYEMNQGIDPSTFDVTDPEQVMAFQRQAGLKEDAMFGPNTQKAWEEYVNRRRATEGEEQYDFGVRSLVDLVDEEGKPDDAKIQAQTKRQDYKGDVSTQSNWERFQDSLGDTVSDYFGGFWK